MGKKIIFWYQKSHPVLLIVFISMLIVDVIVDHNNSILDIKYFLFVSVFLIWLPEVLFKKFTLPRFLVIILVFISFFMPFYALSIGLLNNFIINTDIGEIVYFNSFFFFTLILIIYDKNYDLAKIINFAAFSIVIITLSSYLIALLSPAIYLDLVQYLVLDKNVAVFALRQYGDFTIPMMYYRTSPLLVFPLAYLLHSLLIDNNRDRFFLKLIFLSSVMFTLLISGTRANILSLFLIIVFYLGYYFYNKSKVVFVFALLIFAAISIYAVLDVVDLLFDKQEESNSIKYGHLISYIDFFYENTLTLFTGQGLGNGFYSSGINKITSVTELTYLEIIRIWGLPIGLVFILTLIYPILAEIKSKRISSLFIAYLAYLFIAGTNPFILSSTGMVVLVSVFSKAFKENDRTAEPEDN